jgi:uncharacterized membrane protein YgcG
MASAEQAQTDTHRQRAVRLVERIESGDAAPELTEELVKLCKRSGVARLAVSGMLPQLSTRGVVAPLRAHDDASLCALHLVCELGENVPEIGAIIARGCPGTTIAAIVRALAWESTLAARLLQMHYRRHQNASTGTNASRAAQNEMRRKKEARRAAAAATLGSVGEGGAAAAATATPAAAAAAPSSRLTPSAVGAGMAFFNRVTGNDDAAASSAAAAQGPPQPPRRQDSQRTSLGATELESFYKLLEGKQKLAERRMQSGLRTEWRECLALGGGRHVRANAEILTLRLLWLRLCGPPKLRGGATEQERAAHARLAAGARRWCRELLDMTLASESDGALGMMLMLLDEAAVRSTKQLLVLKLLLLLGNYAENVTPLLGSGLLERLGRVIDGELRATMTYNAANAGTQARMDAWFAQGEGKPRGGAAEQNQLWHYELESPAARARLSMRTAMALMTRLATGSAYSAPGPIRDLFRRKNRTGGGAAGDAMLTDDELGGNDGTRAGKAQGGGNDGAVRERAHFTAHQQLLKRHFGSRATVASLFRWLGAPLELARRRARRLAKNVRNSAFTDKSDAAKALATSLDHATTEILELQIFGGRMLHWALTSSDEVAGGAPSNSELWVGSAGDGAVNAAMQPGRRARRASLGRWRNNLPRKQSAESAEAARAARLQAGVAMVVHRACVLRRTPVDAVNPNFELVLNGMTQSTTVITDDLGQTAAGGTRPSRAVVELSSLVNMVCLQLFVHLTAGGDENESRANLVAQVHCRESRAACAARLAAEDSASKRGRRKLRGRAAARRAKAGAAMNAQQRAAATFTSLADALLPLPPPEPPAPEPPAPNNLDPSALGVARRAVAALGGASALVPPLRVLDAIDDTAADVAANKKARAAAAAVAANSAAADLSAAQASSLVDVSAARQRAAARAAEMEEYWSSPRVGCALAAALSVIMPAQATEQSAAEVSVATDVAAFFENASQLRLKGKAKNLGVLEKVRKAVAARAARKDVGTVSSSSSSSGSSNDGSSSSSSSSGSDSGGSSSSSGSDGGDSSDNEGHVKYGSGTAAAVAAACSDSDRDIDSSEAENDSDEQEAAEDEQPGFLAALDTAYVMGVSDPAVQSLALLDQQGSTEAERILLAERRHPGEQPALQPRPPGQLPNIPWRDTVPTACTPDAVLPMLPPARALGAVSSLPRWPQAEVPGAAVASSDVLGAEGVDACELGWAALEAAIASALGRSPPSYYTKLLSKNEQGPGGVMAGGLSLLELSSSHRHYHSLHSEQHHSHRASASGIQQEALSAFVLGSMLRLLRPQDESTPASKGAVQNPVHGLLVGKQKEGTPTFVDTSPYDRLLHRYKRAAKAAAEAYKASDEAAERVKILALALNANVKAKEASSSSDGDEDPEGASYADIDDAMQDAIVREAAKKVKSAWMRRKSANKEALHLQIKHNPFTLNRGNSGLVQGLLHNKGKEWKEARRVARKAKQEAEDAVLKLNRAHATLFTESPTARVCALAGARTRLLGPLVGFLNHAHLFGPVPVAELGSEAARTARAAVASGRAGGAMALDYDPAAEPTKKAPGQSTANGSDGVVVMGLAAWEKGGVRLGSAKDQSVRAALELKKATAAASSRHEPAAASEPLMMGVRQSGTSLKFNGDLVACPPGLLLPRTRPKAEALQQGGSKRVAFDIASQPSADQMALDRELTQLHEACALSAVISQRLHQRLVLEAMEAAAREEAAAALVHPAPAVEHHYGAGGSDSKPAGPRRQKQQQQQQQQQQQHKPKRRMMSAYTGPDPGEHQEQQAASPARAMKAAHVTTETGNAHALAARGRARWRNGAVALELLRQFSAHPLTSRRLLACGQHHGNPSARKGSDGEVLAESGATRQRWELGGIDERGSGIAELAVCHDLHAMETAISTAGQGPCGTELKSSLPWAKKRAAPKKPVQRRMSNTSLADELARNSMHKRSSRRNGGAMSAMAAAVAEADGADEHSVPPPRLLSTCVPGLRLPCLQLATMAKQLKELREAKHDTFHAEPEAMAAAAAAATRAAKASQTATATAGVESSGKHASIHQHYYEGDVQAVEREVSLLRAASAAVQLLTTALCPSWRAIDVAARERLSIKAHEAVEWGGGAGGAGFFCADAEVARAAFLDSIKSHSEFAKTAVRHEIGVLTIQGAVRRWVACARASLAKKKMKKRHVERTGMSYFRGEWTKNRSYGAVLRAPAKLGGAMHSIQMGGGDELEKSRLACAQEKDEKDEIESLRKHRHSGHAHRHSRHHSHHHHSHHHRHRHHHHRPLAHSSTDPDFVLAGANVSQRDSAGGGEISGNERFHHPLPSAGDISLRAAMAAVAIRDEEKCLLKEKKDAEHRRHVCLKAAARVLRGEGYGPERELVQAVRDAAEACDAVERKGAPAPALKSKIKQLWGGDAFGSPKKKKKKKEDGKLPELDVADVVARARTMMQDRTFQKSAMSAISKVKSRFALKAEAARLVTRRHRRRFQLEQRREAATKRGLARAMAVVVGGGASGDCDLAAMAASSPAAAAAAASTSAGAGGGRRGGTAAAAAADSAELADAARAVALECLLPHVASLAVFLDLHPTTAHHHRHHHRYHAHDKAKEAAARKQKAEKEAAWRRTEDEKVVAKLAQKKAKQGRSRQKKLKKQQHNHHQHQHHNHQQHHASRAAGRRVSTHVHDHGILQPQVQLIARRADPSHVASPKPTLKKKQPKKVIKTKGVKKKGGKNGRSSSSSSGSSSGGGGSSDSESESESESSDAAPSSESSSSESSVEESSSYDEESSSSSGGESSGEDDLAETGGLGHGNAAKGAPHLRSQRHATSASVLALLRLLCGDVRAAHTPEHGHADEGHWVVATAQHLAKPLLRMLPHLAPHRHADAQQAGGGGAAPVAEGDDGANAMPAWRLLRVALGFLGRLLRGAGAANARSGAGHAGGAAVETAELEARLLSNAGAVRRVDALARHVVGDVTEAAARAREAVGRARTPAMEKAVVAEARAARGSALRLLPGAFWTLLAALARHPPNRTTICVGDSAATNRRCGRLLALVIERLLLPLPDVCRPWLRKREAAPADAFAVGQVEEGGDDAMSLEDAVAQAASDGAEAKVAAQRIIRKARAAEEQTQTLLCGILAQLIHCTGDYVEPPHIKAAAAAIAAAGGDAAATAAAQAAAAAAAQEALQSAQDHGGATLCTLPQVGAPCVSRLLELLLFGSGGLEGVRQRRNLVRAKKSAETARAMGAQRASAAGSGVGKQQPPIVPGEATPKANASPVASAAVAAHLPASAPKPDPATGPAPAPAPVGVIAAVKAAEATAKVDLMATATLTKKLPHRPPSPKLGRRQSLAAIDALDSIDMHIGEDDNSGSAATAMLQSPAASPARTAAVAAAGEAGVVHAGLIPESVTVAAARAVEADKLADAELMAALDASALSSADAARDWALRTAAARALAKLADDGKAAISIAEPHKEAIPLLVQLLRVRLPMLLPLPIAFATGGFTLR